MTTEENEVYRKFMMLDLEKLYKSRDELESLNEDIIKVAAQKKFTSFRRNFKEQFLKNNVSIENYPKISKYFFSDL